MNKKLLLLIFSSLLLVLLLSINNKAHAQENKDFFSDDIIALSHSDGETVNFINSDMKEYFDSSASDIEKLKTLYENNDDILSFPSNSYDHEYVRELYSKYDDYKPVNNVLKWKSNVSALSFDIVVSLSADLTEAVYEEFGLVDPEYKMINPYSNTHYFWQVTANTKHGKIKSSIFDFYSGDYIRTIDIEALSNVRDLGGFSSKYGEIRQGLVYRSGRLDDINSSGIEDLKALNIQTDLDLRSVGEGLQNPAKLNNYSQKTLLSYTQDLIEQNRAQTVEAIRVFAEPNNYPIIFHCAVGRDRTGTLAIILKALLGASKEHIIHDYFASMWSVTGAYQKNLEGLNINLVNGTIRILESYGDSLSDGAEKFLQVRKSEITGEDVGLSIEEIQTIKDIWTGKIEVNNAPKTFKAQENYEGKVFVKIKTYGEGCKSFFIKSGEKLEAITNSLGLMYYSNGELFDFSAPINDTTFIYTDFTESFIITLHFIGILKNDMVLKLNYGDDIDFDEFKVEGFDLLVISDRGKEVESLNVTRDMTINMIYFKK